MSKKKTPAEKPRRSDPVPDARLGVSPIPGAFSQGSILMSPPIYPVFDTDLGRDNLENDLTEADR